MTRKGNVLGEALDGAVERIVKNWVAKIARLGVQLIEEPGYRLAGAEEAIRHLSGNIGQSLERYETMLQELPALAAEAHRQIREFMALLEESRGTRRAATVVAGLAEMLPLYPKYRFQSLVLRRVATVYTTLRGQLSDLVREINFCRARLSELVKAFEQAIQLDPAALNVARHLAAARRLHQPRRCGPPAHRAIEPRGHARPGPEDPGHDPPAVPVAEGNLPGLGQPGAGAGGAHAREQSEAFVGGRLVSSSVVEMFLSRYGQGVEADKMLAEAFEDATPKLSKFADDPELRVLALPPGASAELLKTQIIRSLPDAKPTMIDSPDDVLFYRERPLRGLANLPQLSPAAEDAYRQIINSDPLSPHNRIDITDWLPLKTPNSG